jgi:hypothetical protein
VENNSDKRNIVELLKDRLTIEEQLLNKISRFLMLLERKQPGAIRQYQNVCLLPNDPSKVVIVFQDLDDNFSREFPVDIVDSLDEQKLVHWLHLVDSEDQATREAKMDAWERDFIKRVQEKHSSLL